MKKILIVTLIFGAYLFFGTVHAESGTPKPFEKIKDDIKRGKDQITVEKKDFFESQKENRDVLRKEVIDWNAQQKTERKEFQEKMKTEKDALKALSPEQRKDALNKLQDERALFQETMKTGREEFRNDIKEKRAGIKENHEIFKDELEQKKQELESKRHELKQARLYAMVTRFETLVTRIESRIQKIASTGKDTTNAKKTLDIAKNILVDIKTTIQENQSSDDTQLLVSLKSKFEELHSKLKETISLLK